MFKLIFCFAAYDGPGQAYDIRNQDNTTTKVQVLQVTSDATNDYSGSEDEIDDISVPRQKGEF